MVAPPAHRPRPSTMSHGFEPVNGNDPLVAPVALTVPPPFVTWAGLTLTAVVEVVC